MKDRISSYKVYLYNLFDNYYKEIIFKDRKKFIFNKIVNLDISYFINFFYRNFKFLNYLKLKE